MPTEFRWNAWNRGHATKHGVSVEEAEEVARNPGRGYPMAHGDGKFLVVGRGRGGRFVQVVYVLDDDRRRTRYVIHAMPLGRRRR